MVLGPLKERDFDGLALHGNREPIFGLSNYRQVRQDLAKAGAVLESLLVDIESLLADIEQSDRD